MTKNERLNETSTEDKRQNEDKRRYIAWPLYVPITLGSNHAEGFGKGLREGLLLCENGKGARKYMYDIIIHVLASDARQTQ